MPGLPMPCGRVNGNSYCWRRVSTTQKIGTLFTISVGYIANNWRQIKKNEFSYWHSYSQQKLKMTSITLLIPYNTVINFLYLTFSNVWLMLLILRTFTQTPDEEEEIANTWLLEPSRIRIWAVGRAGGFLILSKPAAI